MDNARKVAKLLAVNVDWLLTGRHPRNYPDDDPTGARLPAPETGEVPVATLNPRHQALIGLFDGLTEAQQEAYLRQLQDQKHLNDELLTQLLARRQAL